MSHPNARVLLCCVLICSTLCLTAQQTASPDSIVPSLVKFTGILAEADGKPVTGTVGVTFLLYKEQTDGAPLWLETQNVQADKNGHYSAMLGAASAQGLPADVFVGGEARWLGVQASGQAEQPRVLLVSVPYALKALDAETLGGKPASFFMSASGSGAGAGSGQDGSRKEGPQINYNITCSSGTACQTGFVPVFSTSGGKAKVSGSIITQSSGAVAIAGSESVTSSAGTPAILGTSSGTSGTSNGVQGVTGSATASGVAGINSSGIGVYGFSSGTAATSAGVWGQTSSATGAGVEGVNTANDPNATGIYGYSNSYGIVGSSPNVGVRGYSSSYSGTGIGVSGYSSSVVGNGTGVYGQLAYPSTGLPLSPAGVWGDSGWNYSTGVLGTASGFGSSGGFFLNNDRGATLSAYNFAINGFSLSAWNSANGKGCNVDAFGNLNCDGSKNAVVPLDGGKRKVAMSAIESPENWFEDFGSAQLINGVAVITLDPDFIQTVNTEKNYRVFPVPNGDCKGLYVTNKTANSFEVRELGGGTSNVTFDYRITAIRKNYETVRFADHTKDPDPKKMLEQMHMAKPASASAPALVKPALPALAFPVAQLKNK